MIDILATTFYPDWASLTKAGIELIANQNGKTALLGAIILQMGGIAATGRELQIELKKRGKGDGYF